MNAAIIMIIVLLVLIILGLPISFALFVSVITSSLASGTSLFVMIQRAFSYNNSFTLLAIPLFFIAGELMLVGGISKRLVDFAYSLFGWAKSCFAIISFVACAFFGAISGSSFATTAAIGSIMYPRMVEDGYKPSFAAAIQATGGTLGTLIPPAILCIIYASQASCSAGDMFISIAYAGIFATIGYSLAAILVIKFDKTAYIQKKAALQTQRQIVRTMEFNSLAEKKEYLKKARKESAKKLWKSFIGAFWALLSPVLVLGGIYSGAVTPSECAIVATVYSLICGFFIYKELTLKTAAQAIVRAIIGSAAIMFLLDAGNPFSYILAIGNVPTKMALAITSFISNKFVFLLCVNVIYLIGGMFMDTSCLLTILTPLFYLMLGQYDINVLHFGVISVFNMTLGTLTPPFGGGVFVASATTKVNVVDIFKSNTPLLLSGVAMLLIITYVPLIWL